MNNSEYADYDALGLAALVRAGEVRPVELLDTALAAAARLNKDLNSLLEVFPQPDQQATDSAAPFAGVPFLIKDLALHRHGGTSELGSRLAQGMITPADTYLMQRFRQAGLVTFGRTNTPEFGHACTTEPVLHGPTRNPWNLQRMAGGSSGGSAAAVAAGIVPVAHANDGAGSIRNPAACCGLVGLKPTRGRVSAGPDQGDPLLGNGIELGVSRTVRDTAALLDVAAGAMPGDPSIAPAPPSTYLDAATRPPGQLKIAFTCDAWSGDEIVPEVIAAVEQTAAQLQSLGHIVEQASPQFDYALFRQCSIVAWSTFIAAGADAISRLLNRPVDENHLEAATLTMYHYGKSVQGLEILKAIAGFNTVCRSVAPFFERYDVLLTPVTSREPQPLGTYNQNRAGITREEWFDHKGSFTPFLALFNATGQPAISLPLAMSANGLPLGMQFAGRFGEEHVLLSLAGQLEQALPWKHRKPAHSLWGLSTY